MRTNTLFNCIEMPFFTHKLHPRIVISNGLQSSFYILRFRRAVRQLLEFWRDFQMANATKAWSWHVNFVICSTLGSQKNNNITYILHFYQFYKEMTMPATTYGFGGISIFRRASPAWVSIFGGSFTKFWRISRQCARVEWALGLCFSFRHCSIRYHNHSHNLTPCILISNLSYYSSRSEVNACVWLSPNLSFHTITVQVLLMSLLHSHRVL